MDPSAESPPLPPPPNEKNHVPMDIPPDVPLRRIIAHPFFSGPDPVKAVPEDYFPNKEVLGSYVNQLRESLQSLVQCNRPY